MKKRNYNNKIDRMLEHHGGYLGQRSRELSK